MRDTGVSHMTPQQREAFNAWLSRYTMAVMSIANHRASASVAAPTPGSCSPAVESSITGEFHGWDGETIFKLDNGQIWEQAEYDYMYSYSYHPDVTIYMTTGGCRMKVEDEDETIVVRRIK